MLFTEKLASPFLCGIFKLVVCAIDMPWVDRYHMPFTHWNVMYLWHFEHYHLKLLLDIKYVIQRCPCYLWVGLEGQV